MLFNSIQFLVFLPIVISLYFALPPKWRTLFLLAASYYFYMCWRAEYVILILGSTVVDYCAAIMLNRATSPKVRKLWLIVSLTSNLGMLFFFKYFDFFSENISSLFESINIFYDKPVFQMLLPVGISFYTFQTLSYTIDVYNGKLEPERNFPRFALFVSFFPQLVAGPIERATHLLPQFKRTNNFDHERIVSGLRLILWGMFKKVVVADNLARVVNQVYENPAGQNGLTYAIATYFFAFQIYCDFSGYSDIAIGTARVMGIDLMQNFRQPYLSRSIGEFWSRWHISLSTWFRDYVYIPLGGNRTVKWRWYYNLMITFVVSGLWHGANWTFIVWGALHGVFLVVGIQWAKLVSGEVSRWRSAIQVIFVFHLVLLSWVFFRADNMSEAINVLGEIVQLPYCLAAYLQGVSLFTGFGPFSIISVLYLVLLIIGLYAVDWVTTLERAQKIYYEKPVVRWITYFVLLYGILLAGYFGETEFIYFQF